MKIALPVDSNSRETGICPSFGRAPYFLIYETETKKSTFIDNSAIASQGGAGIKAAQVIIDQGATILITPRCGENAAEVITAAGIKIYKTTSDSVADNIAAFTQGKLTVLEEIHPGLHRHGAN